MRILSSIGAGLILAAAPMVSALRRITTSVILSACILPMSPSAAPIQSLVLVSTHAGEFNYGLEVTLDHGLFLAPGSLVELDGLSGITGASVTGLLAVCFTVASAGPATVLWVASITCPVFDPVPATVVLDGLHLFSSSADLGSVDYQVRAETAGILSGVVAGPAQVDAPSTFWLLIIAALAFLTFGRRGVLARPAHASQRSA